MYNPFIAGFSPEVFCVSGSYMYDHTFHLHFFFFFHLHFFYYLLLSTFFFFHFKIGQWNEIK